MKKLLFAASLFSLSLSAAVAQTAPMQGTMQGDKVKIKEDKMKAKDKDADAKVKANDKKAKMKTEDGKVKANAKKGTIKSKGEAAEMR